MSLGPLFGGEVSLRVLLYGEAGDDLAVAAGGLAHAGQEVQEEPEEEQHGDGEQRETAVLEAEQAGEDPEELGYHRDEGDAEGDEQREEQVEPAPPSAVPVEAVRREEQRYDDAGDAYVFGLRHQILLASADASLMRLLPFFQLTFGTSESILSGCSGAVWSRDGSTVLTGGPPAGVRPPPAASTARWRESSRCRSGRRTCGLSR